MSPKNLRKYSSQALGTFPGIENPNFWDPLERPGDALNLIANCNIWLIFKEDRITAKVYSQLAKRWFRNAQRFETHNGDREIALMKAVTVVAARMTAHEKVLNEERKEGKNET